MDLAKQTTTLITSNDEIKEFTKIVKSLEDSGLLLKGVSETIQNEVKEQKGGFPNMLLGTLGASLLGDMLVGKGINRAGEGFIRAAIDPKDFQSKNFLILPHPLTMKDEARVINLDKNSDIGTHWIVLHALNNIVTYFHSFGVEHIPKKSKILLINL